MKAKILEMIAQDMMPFIRENREISANSLRTLAKTVVATFISEKPVYAEFNHWEAIGDSEFNHILGYLTKNEKIKEVNQLDSETLYTKVKNSTL